MDKRVLLIIGGGIAAYKSLFLIRVLAKRGIKSRVILTKGGSEFVTALSAGGLSGDKVYSDLFDLCLLYTSPSPRDATLSRMPSSA